MRPGLIRMRVKSLSFGVSRISIRQPADCFTASKRFQRYSELVDHHVSPSILACCSTPTWARKLAPLYTSFTFQLLSQAHSWEIISKNDNLSFLTVLRLVLQPGRQSRPEGLDRYVDIGVAGVEGVVVGEDHVFGAVGAEGGFVVAADDGEGVEDVGG